jgi:hypothetical protein
MMGIKIMIIALTNIASLAMLPLLLSILRWLRIWPCLFVRCQKILWRKNPEERKGQHR